MCARVAVDADALLSALREKFGNAKATISKKELHDLFLGIGYDKITTEELPEEEEAGGEEAGEEGEEGGGDAPAKPPRAPPKQEISKHAETTFDLIAGSRASSVATMSGGAGGETVLVAAAGSAAAAASAGAAAASGGAGADASADAPAAAAAADPSLPLAQVMVTLFICKAGFGEPALRFAVKVHDPEVSARAA